jgi:hypothetical protein
MGSYGAYQREAREIVDELRQRGVLEPVMNGTQPIPWNGMTYCECGELLGTPYMAVKQCSRHAPRITPAEYWADLNERMPD